MRVGLEPASSRWSLVRSFRHPPYAAPHSQVRVPPLQRRHLPMPLRLRGQTFSRFLHPLTPSAFCERSFGSRTSSTRCKGVNYGNNYEKNQSNQSQGFRAEPRIFLSKDGEYLIHVPPENMIVRKHVNFYKKVLSMDFVLKPKLVGRLTDATIPHARGRIQAHQV